ncbi:MAG: hypothetical protein ACK5V3_18505, partial [Bdellovibrionales bacterium]
IEVLAERMATLPKELDLKPLVDQLGKLQSSKVDMEEELKRQESEKPQVDVPISFEDLKSFRKGLRTLVAKGELDKAVQTEIIRKVVHKITIKPDGFEIHFHVGKAYYSREPDQTGSRFLSFENGNKKSSGFSKPARGSQISDFFKDQGSSLLTIGDPTRN